MGHPVTSLTWLINWARERGRPVRAGDVVSTGTCTGHLFAAPGDTVRADFGPFGVVQARFGPVLADTVLADTARADTARADTGPAGTAQAGTADPGR